jgi:hypothetical protein
MKNLSDPDLTRFRDASADRIYRTQDADREWGGAFLIPTPAKGRNGPGGWTASRALIRVIASRGDVDAADEESRWDHVSVSLADRCPTWEEMEFVKRLFFKPGEVAFQLHVPPARHISNHEFCLHIWRPVDREIPLPPESLVGIPGLGSGARGKG